jgi:hypothetical protein
MCTLRVYSRQNCHLCDVLLSELGPLVDGRIGLEVRDVDTRDEWREAFGWRVPCVEYEDRVICEYQLDREAISAILAAQS